MPIEQLDPIRRARENHVLCKYTCAQFSLIIILCQWLRDDSSAAAQIPTELYAATYER